MRLNGTARNRNGEMSNNASLKSTTIHRFVDSPRGWTPMFPLELRSWTERISVPINQTVVCLPQDVPSGLFSKLKFIARKPTKRKSFLQFRNFATIICKIAMKAHRDGRIEENGARSCRDVEQSDIADVVVRVKDFPVRFPGAVETVRPETLIVSLLQVERDPCTPMILLFEGLVSLQVLVDHSWNWIE